MKISVISAGGAGRYCFYLGMVYQKDNILVNNVSSDIANCSFVLGGMTNGNDEWICVLLD